MPYAHGEGIWAAWDTPTSQRDAVTWSRYSNPSKHVEVLVGDEAGKAPFYPFLAQRESLHVRS